VTPDYEGRRVLITGGAGFIGSNLARKLVEAGSKVTIVDSLIPEYGGNLTNIADLAGRVDLNISDIRDRHSLRYLVRDVDILFNLAGQTSHIDSMRDPVTDMDINARAQLDLLETCRAERPSVRIVFASTRQVYGRPQFLPVTETHPLAPVDVNGITKLAGEWFHRLYSSVYGIRTIVLRLTNTYGPGMRVKDARQTFLGIWVKRLLSGDDILIYGDGTQLRDFTYVSDVVSALMDAPFHAQAFGELFNLGGLGVHSLLSVAKTMIDVHGEGSYRLVSFPEENRSIDIGDFYADWSAAERVLDWRPHVELRDGLRETLAYYRVHQADYFS
jgi:nucleoside-diphosphate-sugar epimerase